MKIEFEIMDGLRNDRGKSFVIERSEPDNITIGRSSLKSEKYGQKYPHLQISSDDLRLSRWHCLVEIRSPNVYICDIGSTNKTFVNDLRRGSHIMQQAELKDGDIVKMGRTCIKVHIEDEQSEEIEKYYCTKCGKEIEGLDEKSADEIGAHDFICDECSKAEIGDILIAGKREGLLKWVAAFEDRKGIEENTAQPEKTGKEEGPVPREGECPSVRCFTCGKNPKRKSGKHPHMEESNEGALYLCEDCALAEREGKEKLGDYVLLKKIGVGGMGEVYKGWHKPTGMMVAIKELLPDKQMDERALKVFHREISITRELTHPHIVRFYDSFSKKGKPCLITEYLPGGNAEDAILKKGVPFSINDGCEIILDILEGLSYAHERGIIHRDIKPQNILFDRSGHSKLSDMGLAKSFELAGQSGITNPGDIGGTPLYIAPEQILDFRYVKPTADVYSVGMCLYYFLTGKYAYDYPSPLDILNNKKIIKRVQHPFAIVFEDDPIPVSERKPSLPAPLCSVIDRCLIRNPEKRFRNGKELGEALRKACGQG